MRKKLGIRILGVVALLAWVAACYFVWIYSNADTHRVREGSAMLVGLFGVAGFVLSFAWACWSAIDWILRRQAALRAAQLAQGLPGVAPRPWPAIAAPHPAAPQAAAAVLCAFCRVQPAAWLCSRHQWPACLACANAHLQAEPQCTYAPLQPYAPAPAAGPRAVVTSPLAGLR